MESSKNANTLMLKLGTLLNMKVEEVKRKMMRRKPLMIKMKMKAMRMQMLKRKMRRARKDMEEIKHWQVFSQMSKITKKYTQRLKFSYKSLKIKYAKNMMSIWRSY